jgi:hypothetical protein
MENYTHTVQVQDYRGHVIEETERMSYMEARALARHYNEGEGVYEAYVIPCDYTVETNKTGE